MKLQSQHSSCFGRAVYLLLIFSATTPLRSHGKVHGSLASAGKTAKVVEQDKKKQLRGRAHKGLQYNRRSVTPVVGIGKKRGPNLSEK